MTSTLSPVSAGTMPKLMRNGCRARQEKNIACRQRLSGNTPPVAIPVPRVTGEATLMRLADMRMLRTRRQRHRYAAHHPGRHLTARMVFHIPPRWAASRLMHSDRMTCWEMFGNGQRTVTTTAIKAPRLTVVPGKGMVRNACFAVARGTTHRGMCVRLCGTATSPHSVSASSGFAWPGCFRSAGD